MKKILLICIIIVGIAFVSGCIGGEKATDSKTSKDSQTNQKSDTQKPDTILKLSDIPSGFVLKQYANMAVQKSVFCTYIELSKQYKGNCSSIAPYDESIPIGKRYIGSDMTYSTTNGRSITVRYLIFDSNEGVKEMMEKVLKNSNAPVPNYLFGSTGQIQFTEKGKLNLGEYSVWGETENPTNPDVTISVVIILIKNTYVTIGVVDEKQIAHDEALKIAEIVANRLD